MKKKRPDVAWLLSQLAEARKALPVSEEEHRPRSSHDGLTASDGWQPRTEEEFEYAALMDAVETLRDDIAVVVERQNAELMAEAMEAYYVAEELARDPEHADLIPHLERIREAYKRDTGHPIPPRPKK